MGRSSTKMGRHSIESRCFKNTLCEEDELAVEKGKTIGLRFIEKEKSGEDAKEYFNCSDDLGDNLGSTYTILPNVRIQLESTLKKVAEYIFQFKCNGDCSVYTGCAGIDYAKDYIKEFYINMLINNLNSNGRRGRDNAYADEITKWSEIYKISCKPPIINSKFILNRRKSSHDDSLLCGASGMWWVIAQTTMSSFIRKTTFLKQNKCTETSAAGAVTPASAAASDAADALHHYFVYVRGAATSATYNEWLYGRAGLLIGGLKLLKTTKTFVSGLRQLDRQQKLKPDDVGGFKYWDDCLEKFNIYIEQLGESLLNAGVRKNSDILSYAWHGDEYIGAAHGYFGILYALMCIPNVRINKSHKFRVRIQATLDYLISFMNDKYFNFPAVVGEEDVHLVHFCHGAPGAVYAYIEASYIFNNEVYRDIYIKLANCIWKFGILKKGFGVCHGVSGNGYALLRVYRQTNDSIWLDRAVYFACILYSKELISAVRSPDNPYSLFEGCSGALTFLCDILTDPKNALLPLYDVAPDIQ